MIRIILSFDHNFQFIGIRFPWTIVFAQYLRIVDKLQNGIFPFHQLGLDLVCKNPWMTDRQKALTHFFYILYCYIFNKD